MFWPVAFLQEPSKICFIERRVQRCFLLLCSGSCAQQKRLGRQEVPNQCGTLLITLRQWNACLTLTTLPCTHVDGFCFGSFISALYFVAFHMLRSISEYFVITVHAVAWALCARCRHSVVVICCLCEFYLLKVIPFTADPGHDLTACVAFMFKFMHPLRMPADSTFGVCRVQYYPLKSSRSQVSPFYRALKWCLLHAHTQRAYVHAVPRH